MRHLHILLFLNAQKYSPLEFDHMSDLTLLVTLVSLPLRLQLQYDDLEPVQNEPLTLRAQT